MKKKRLIIIVAFLTLFTQFGFSQDCKKCDIEKLLDLSENLENLNYETVKNFICTFDSSCINNIEFSEWSNELLYKLVEKDINLLNDVLHDLGFNYVKLICKELETPILDVDLKRIYDLIEKSHGPNDMIVAEKNAIIKAAQNEGIKLE